MPSDFLQPTVDYNLFPRVEPQGNSKQPPQPNLTRQQLVETVSSLLEEMIQGRLANYLTADEIPTKTPFHAQKLPPISIKSYLERFAKFSDCSDDTFIYALIYLDKAGELCEDFNLDSFNVLRVILTCLVIACKFNNDFYYKNSYYAKIGGLKADEFNALEREFLLDYVQFSLYVSHETYNEYVQDLIGYHQDKQTTDAS